MKTNQIPSSWKSPCSLSSPGNILEQVWRTTPNFQSIFDPPLASSASASSVSSYISQSGFKHQHQSHQPPTRDSIIHSSSQSQLLKE
ncbi:hypothetical protein KSF78_0004572 [Schistosoma japonicum]|nr:hypothetical protein KSF78_0004572 [Schistosoma japonicum]